MHVVFLVHYFPPVNSSGAKRVEALSKYLAAAGHEVTVITTRKDRRDGDFTESVPPGVRLVELAPSGRLAPSSASGGEFRAMYEGGSPVRSIKNFVMEWCGQLPDTRLPFALSLASPWLSAEAVGALRRADVVVGSCPPWPMLLAALVARFRFGKPCVLDYRDQFSECHEMPGSALAKWLERKIDGRMAAAADHVVTVSDPMTRYYQQFSPRVTTIRNGYDPEVLDEARGRAERDERNRITIRYMGLVSPGRVPHQFFRALVAIRRRGHEGLRRLKVEFFGSASLIDRAVDESYPELRGVVSVERPVAYRDSMKKIVEADYLLFCETSSADSLSAQGILTTKLLEYIGAGRPVLAEISPETLAGRLLRECGPQHVITDSAERFIEVLSAPAFWQRHPDQISLVSQSLSRRAQAGEYTTLLQRVITNNSSVAHNA